MKTAILSLLTLVALSLTSCSVSGHANRKSTGAGFSTAPVSASGAVRY